MIGDRKKLGSEVDIKDPINIPTRDTRSIPRCRFSNKGPRRGQRADKSSHGRSGNKRPSRYGSSKERESDLFAVGLVPSFRAAEAKLRSASALFAQEKKLAMARSRREHELTCREKRAHAANRRRHVVTQKILKKRWYEDRARETASHEMRCTNESIILQRKVIDFCIFLSDQTPVHKHHDVKFVGVQEHNKSAN